jgi:membrane protease YdiL (CAAX protease family)
VVKNSTSARSPLSPTLWPADAFVWWQSLLFALGIVISEFLFAVLVGIVWSLVVGFKELRPPSLRLTLVVQVATYLPLLLLAVLVLPLLAKRSLRELGVRLPTISEVGIGVAGALAMFVVSGAIGALEEHVMHVKVQEEAVDLLKSVHGWAALWFGLIACVFAPLAEEFAFRAFLFNALLRYVPVPAAIIVSALIFGAAHGSWSALLPIAGVGVVLAIVYYRTGALTASMIAHSGFNLIAVVGTFVFKN